MKKQYYICSKCGKKIIHKNIFENKIYGIICYKKQITKQQLNINSYSEAIQRSREEINIDLI